LRARHRLGKFLLRRGLIWRGGKKAWTRPYRDWGWVRGLRFEDAADQAVVASYLLAIEQVEERVRTLEAQPETVAREEPYRERVGWLRCVRGIDTSRDHFARGASRLPAVQHAAGAHGLPRARADEVPHDLGPPRGRGRAPRRRSHGPWDG